MADPTFTKRHRLICDLYYNNDIVRKAIDVNVEYYFKPYVQRYVEKHGWGYDPDVIWGNSRDYLLEEYAGTAIYKKFVPTETQVYWGIYIEDTHVFDRHSPDIDLVLPRTLPVFNNRIGSSVASIKLAA